MSDLSNMSIDFLRKGQAPQANELAMRAVKATPNDWHAHYALGQCFQFAEQWIQAAMEYETARRLRPNDKSLLLVLGIARQKERRYTESVDALQEAIRLDPDFDLAYNSLGMTYKLAGNSTNAMAAYDSGMKSVAGQVAKALRNRIDGPRYPYKLTQRGIWLTHLRYAAEVICKREGVHLPPVLPTAEQIEQDGRTQIYRGWFWEGFINQMNLKGLNFRPNFQNAVFEGLKASGTYVTLLRNFAAILLANGQRELARDYSLEADDFS